MGKRPGGERIGIISPLFSDPAQHGGITPVVLNLVRGMAARGVNVDLVLRRAEPRSPLTQELPNGVRTIDIPSRHRITT
ncbi:MAG: hypothetical protein JXR72_07330, partial [Proteobacteria bacterium]|nr:hypothetical protein [Pseudomonadota bacterium]